MYTNVRRSYSWLPFFCMVCWGNIITTCPLPSLRKIPTIQITINLSSEAKKWSCTSMMGSTSGQNPSGSNKSPRNSSHTKTAGNAGRLNRNTLILRALVYALTRVVLHCLVSKCSLTIHIPLSSIWLHVCILSEMTFRAPPFITQQTNQVDVMPPHSKQETGKVDYFFNHHNIFLIQIWRVTGCKCPEILKDEYL